MLLIGSAQLSQAQYIAYVTETGNGARTGESWANAFSGSQLQLVINATPAGGQVWVARGTYKPTTDGNRALAFGLRNGVSVYGGFAGNETSLDQRPLIDPVAGKPSSTTLSGDIGIAGDQTDNSYALILNRNVDITARLNGFVLMGTFGNQDSKGLVCITNRSSSPTLEKLTIQGNTAFWGGGMYNENSNPSLNNCSFNQNTATDIGGGMINDQSSPSLTNCSIYQNKATGANGGGGMFNFNQSNPRLTTCSFTENTAPSGGGMKNQQSSPVLIDCRFNQNTAIDFGGGINNFFQSNPSLTNCRFTGNTASNGGGMLNNQSSPSLTNCSFSQNNTTGDLGGGGGMANITNSSPRLNQCSFSQNRAYFGGGIYNQDQGSSPDLRGCSFSQNNASQGGGVFNKQSSPQLDQCKFIANSSESGGGMANDNSSPILSNCSFLDNTATESGGGMSNSYFKGDAGSTVPQLNGCIFTGNTARFGGGMVSDFCQPSLTSCRFSQNKAAYGGGMYNNSASTQLSRCSFIANQADSLGGGIANASSTPQLVNVLFSRNTAIKGGGAINNGKNGFDYRVMILTAINCSFSRNSSPDGGGIRNEDNSNNQLTNCIFWENGGQNTFSGQGEVYANHCLIERQETDFTDTNNLLRVDPLFVNAAADDLRLLACSPAFNAGNSASTTATSGTTDLAGNPRIFGPVIDMGAYEFQGSPASLSLELQPLVDLYNATGGANWSRKDNWLTGCTPCNWYGVTCINGRVTGINLIGNNLSGTLPASLSALSALTSLELGANTLTGGIPTGIGSLTALQTLNLSRTQLGGSIPTSLGQLTRLQNLFLNESGLTGTLPANLGNLTQLQNLQLYTNQLSGCFPGSYTSLCGKQVSFANNPGLPGGGDFAAFCTDGNGGQLVVSQYPQSGTTCVGSAFSFSVVARGAGSYQWYKDGQRLAETGPVLRLASVSASNAGTYQVYINYGCGPGAVQSDYVTLTVPQPGTGGCPQVNTAPVATANASQTALTGQSFSYTVNAFTDEQTPTSLTYSASISPANGLTFNPTTRVVSGIPTTTGASTVTVTATDPGRLSTSTSFNVTVTAPPAPVLTTQPAAGSSVCAGARVRISVAATGSGNLTYQWYKDGGLLSGQTSATLTLDNVTATQGGSYQAVVSNGFNSTTSTAFSLTVNPTPVISISPSSTAICAGQVATLAVSGGASYRWSPGQTSQSISVSATGTYSVTATNASGCLASATASVTVNPLPVISISPTAATVCAGSTLTATPGLTSYRWNTGQTTQSISVATTGTYAVTATTASGYSASATTPVTVTPRPASPYATSVPRRLYTTNFPIPLILYALPTGLGLNLSFYNGATNAQISPAFVQPNKAGVFAYYATQTDSKGCVSLPTPVSLTVLEGGTLATKPTDRTVCSGASTVLSVTATGSNPRYTWYEATPDRPYNVVEAGSNTKGGNTASLTVSKLQRTTLYYCLVIGQNGLDVAGPIKVTLNTNCQGRLGVEEPAAPLSVAVLGNPVQGGELSVEIRGAEGQPLQLRLTDSQGRAVGEQHLPQAEAVERRRFEVGSQPAGLLLLQVSTPTQRQSVKVLKVD